MMHTPTWKTVSTIIICVLLALFAVPNVLPASMKDKWPAFLPHRTVSLGLDLQGGSHLLLEVDTEAYLATQRSNLLDEARSRLRNERIATKQLQLLNKQVSITLLNAADASKAEKALRDIGMGVEVNKTAEDALSVGYTEREEKEMARRVLEQSIEIVDRRVNETGTKEPIIQRQGDKRIVLQVPGLQDPARLKEILGRTASMTFHMVDENVSAQDIMRGVAPFGTKLLPGDETEGDAPRYAVERRALLSGDMLTSASAAYEQSRPVVAFKFNTLGARKFGKITSESLGKRFAVVLDGRVITAPVMQSPILNGSGVITGNFTLESANNLALLLRAGALPAPLNIIEERSVGPSLGADSIASGKAASILGVVLVVVFMMLVYGRFGMYANVALIMNLVAIIGILSLFQATLTLPGIAGLVLTLGMAVDANVLIYERIRDEVRNGRTPFAAVENGFKAAFATITDSNLTTLIAAFIMYYLGSGTIKGFAVTLAIGILCSMFTATVITRLLVARWMNKKRPKVIPL